MAESINLSKEKRDRLINKLHQIKENCDDETFSILSEIENELNRTPYGLVWEEHSEQVDDDMKTKIPVFVNDKSKEIKTSILNKYNFLLEGDNLHSLKLLEKTHKGKIDVIYIDPPYNTGNKDFTYDDRILNSDDEYRHSKWLSFMEKRLKLAHRLMRKNGIIYISIDNNEEAQLRILLDSIFSSNNYLGTIIQNKGNAQNDAINLQKNHEYILCYAKNRKFITINNKKKEIPLICDELHEEKEVFIDECGRYYYKGSSITTGGEGGTLNKRKNLGYTIYYNPKTKDKIGVCDYDIQLALTSNDENKVYTDDVKLLKQGYIKIRPPKKQNKLGVWTWDINRFNREKDSILITDNLAVVKKVFIDETEVEKKGKKLTYYKTGFTKNCKSIWDFSSASGTNSIQEILGAKEFDNPKNVELIKKLIKIYREKENPVVLDFFAGSGTTGQAVLELNREDCKNRNFILCTNNENNICTNVTYRRIKNVIEGYSNHEGIPSNLMYYKTDFINKKRDGSVPITLMKHVKELIQLENHCKIDNKEIMVAFNEDELDKLFEKDLSKCRKLFIPREVFLNTKQKTLLNKHKIEKIYIPEYYFAKELKEVDEL